MAKRTVMFFSLAAALSFCLVPEAKADELFELKEQIRIMQHQDNEQIHVLQKRVERLETERLFVPS